MPRLFFQWTDTAAPAALPAALPAFSLHNAHSADVSGRESFLFGSLPEASAAAPSRRLAAAAGDFLRPGAYHGSSTSFVDVPVLGPRGHASSSLLEQRRQVLAPFLDRAEPTAFGRGALKVKASGPEDHDSEKTPENKDDSAPDDTGEETPKEVQGEAPKETKPKDPEKVIAKVNGQALAIYNRIQDAQTRIPDMRTRLDSAVRSALEELKPLCQEYVMHRQELEHLAGAQCTGAQGRVNSADFEAIKNLKGCVEFPGGRAPAELKPKQQACEVAKRYLMCSQRLDEMTKGAPAPGRPWGASMDEEVYKWCHPIFTMQAKPVSVELAAGVGRPPEDVLTGAEPEAPPPATQA